MEAPDTGMLALQRRARLADLLKSRVAGSSPHSAGIPKRMQGVECPASFAQERFWVMHRLGLPAAAQVIPLVFELEGWLDCARLERCFTDLIARHESLRTRFEEGKGGLVQVVGEPWPFRLRRLDLIHLDNTLQPALVQQWVADLIAEPLTLTQDELIRACVLHVAARRFVLVITSHHIVADGWSMGVLVRELSQLYRSHGSSVSQAGSALAPLPLQYADYALWQRSTEQSERLSRQSDWWREQLSGAPSMLELPYDFPRPAVMSFKGAVRRFSLPKELSQRIVALSNAHGITPFMFFLTSFQVLLARWSGQYDISTGAPVAGRLQAETESLIGLFLNTLVLRTNLAGDPTFLESLARVRQVTLDAYDHQEAPFEQLVAELASGRSLAHQPLYQVGFFFHNTPQAIFDLPGIECRELEVPYSVSRVDLTLVMQNTAAGFAGGFEYSTDLFLSDTIDRLIGRFQQILQAAVMQPLQKISQLPLLTPQERQDLLVRWNSTDLARRPCNSLPELLASRAVQTPSAIALQMAGSSLTYEALERRANLLAHALIGFGVLRETLVGVLLERSIDVVVALLGILKAGGAYLPLDPAHPRGRMEYMLSDSGARILLTRQRFSPEIQVSSLRRVDLEDLREVDAGSEVGAGCGPGARVRAETAPEIPAHQHHLAYLIYTSGSTGQPKGVMIPHGALLNVLACMRRECQVTAKDIVAVTTALTFDIAGLEIWLPLSVGARAVLCQNTPLEPLKLRQELAEADVTLVQATPSGWRLLLDAGLRPSGLKVLCGGEHLPQDLGSSLSRHAGQAWNVYGPTETTIWSTCQPLSEQAPVRIGRPLGNTRLYVLDQWLEPVPVGVTGELYIAGAGLARGYHGQAGLTAEKFIADPFDTSGGRLYRTGDRARYLNDGTIELLGRMDRQIKLRGHRIELAEVEAALLSHPQIKQSAVITRRDPRGETELTAFVVPDGNVDAGQHRVADQRRMALSLFYFASDRQATDGDLYSLYLEAARKADRLGFSAIWTPERHFTEVGAAYPNPSVLSAALAMITERIHLRAGSVVLPLHHPVRVAEEWAAVDRLSRGRVGFAVAPGWAPDDFVFAPETYANRYHVLQENLQRIQLLWRGEALTLTDGLGRPTQIRSLPRPVQQDVPIWLTVTGNPQGFEQAGRLGLNVLTALLTLSVDELAQRIRVYRQALQESGHDSQSRTVTVMLHAFVAPSPSEARQIAREPLKRYFRAHASMREHAFRNLKSSDLASQQEYELLLERGDDDKLTEVIVDRYLESSALIGSPDSCARMIERLEKIGANELACLIDFGIDAPRVLDHLDSLAATLQKTRRGPSNEDIRAHLRTRVPQYMLPSAFVEVQQLPFTSNGKIDYLQLAQLPILADNEEAGRQARPSDPPRTPLENALAALWAQELSLEQVGIHDGFFQMGGHSLAGVRLIRRLREEFDVDLPLTALFEAQTVAQMAERIIRDTIGDTSEESLKVAMEQTRQEGDRR